ncbi:MAG: hypothetical protein J6Q56_02725 [Clostridia bacterium]|nr:hypothetical protein [Clostridia bacterium]
MKRIFALLLCIVLVCACQLSAMAAYVTDGTDFFIAGDADGNGETDLLDLVRAKIYTKDTDTTDVTAAAVDLDGNDVVDGNDLALIRAMLMDINETEWA